MTSIALTNNPITQVTNSPITQVTTKEQTQPKTKRKNKFLQWLCCARDNQTAPASGVPAPLPVDRSLLGPPSERLKNKKCLVLDLDETLVHSSFRPVKNADFIIPVEIDGTNHSVYVLKRPFVDEFMRIMGEHYEIVVFTASLAKYADPVLDKLDIHSVVNHRLFRESCSFHKGSYVKDLGRLGRDLAHTLIIDNSPASYIFHPWNALPITTWLDDPSDTELLDLIPFLIELSKVNDVTKELVKFQANPSAYLRPNVNEAGVNATH